MSVEHRTLNFEFKMNERTRDAMTDLNAANTEIRDPETFGRTFTQNATRQSSAE